MTPILAVLLMALPAREAQAAAWQDEAPPAFARAKKEKKPVLIDFQAPWCYSCYYMEQRVLSKPAFAEAAKALVLLKLDVDKPEGRTLQERYGARALPTYILASEGGEALGRIMGEQTEADFLAKLAVLVKAAAGKKPQAEAESPARLVLKREAHAEKPDPEKAAQAFETLLNDRSSCELAYDWDDFEPFVAKLPAPRKAAVLAASSEALSSLAERRLFGDEKDRCADFRSGVMSLAGVHEARGDEAGKAALLKRAVAYLDARGLKPGEDRNHDDNLRYFLEQAGDDKRLRAHYVALIAAYPADYVYAYRYARWLQELKKPEAAYPWIEKAYALSYGANRLNAAKVRALILSDMGRPEEARTMLRMELKNARLAFPKEADSLEKLIGQLAKKRG